MEFQETGHKLQATGYKLQVTIVLAGFLVGEGARDWAVRHGVPAVASETLISDKANKLYRHYKKKLDAFRFDTFSR
jgi:hypothetical protein